MGTESGSALQCLLDDDESVGTTRTVRSPGLFDLEYSNVEDLGRQVVTYTGSTRTPWKYEQSSRLIVS